MRLQDLTVETFTPLIGELFAAEVGGGQQIELRLLAASGETGAEPGEPRFPFSISFGGPASEMVNQGTYLLSNPTTGPLEIFLVPVGRDETMATYEAVFT